MQGRHDRVFKILCAPRLYDVRKAVTLVPPYQSSQT